MLKSASTITSLLLFEQLKALPGVERMLSDNLKPEEEEAIRKILLQAVAANDYKDLSFEQSMAAYRTNFHANFGATDGSGNYTPETIQQIRESKPVTVDELYRACNYKENPFMEDAFPKLNTMFQSVIIGVGVAGLAAAGTATLPVILAELTLMGTGILTTEFIEGIFEKVKNDNIALCRRTVETYYKESGAKKEVLQSTEVITRSRIPFNAPKKELESKLPDKHPVKVVAQRVDDGTKKDELLTAVLSDLNTYFTEWKTASEQARTQRERQEFLNNLAATDAEISGALYIGRAVIQLLFKDPTLADGFYRVSMAVKDAYINYVKYTMPEPAIGTMALTASWVAVGMTVLSLFSSGGEAKLWNNLFKQLQQLAELIINGFNAVLENQKNIMQQLNFLTETVIRNGKIEQTLLQRLNDQFNQLNGKIDLIDYNQAMGVVINANAQLNTLFNDRKFDLNKDEYRVEYNKYITHYLVHATETACTSNALSGYAMSATGAGVRTLVMNNVLFEYQVGLVPVAISGLTNKLKNFVNTFPGKLANPIEWNRGVDLYLQAHLITKSDSKFVKNHFARFMETGEQLKEFCTALVRKEVVEEIAELHHKHALAVFDILAEYTRQRLLAKNYHLIFKPYRRYLTTKYTLLDRTAFTPVEPGKKSHYQGTSKQRAAKRQKYYAAMESAFANKQLAVLENEIDNDDRFPEHRVYAVDTDVLDIFNTARDLGVIRFTTSTVHRVSGSYHFPVTLYECEFKEGNFSGLNIRFLYEQRSYRRSFPYQEGKSPYDGKMITVLDFEGPNFRTLNPQSWRQQAKTIIKNRALDRSYFKLRKLGDDADILDFSFTEFVINEILHKGDRIRESVLNDAKLDVDFLYRGNIDKSNELNILGYLVVNILTLSQYNSLVTPYDDYRETGIRTKMNANYLVYPPEYAFFEDLVKIFSGILGEDFLNESTHAVKWAAFKPTFTADQNDLSPVFNFVRRHYTDRIDKQRNSLNQLPMEGISINYNIRNTLNVLNQLKVYLATQG
ncbi:hypothetical protein EGT74_21500 [Chitinophaga lutea]|uniref:Uncharacterized protein n=1 Tax=Chitinophaga lutea TaxID=2488634 RepID=A0A3N4QCU3_9BACT|nr:hypothetical protein EGT74_21500 [Chitinophaga lutea]